MATAQAAGSATPPSGNKKLIIILVAVLLLVLVGGGLAVMLLKKKPASDEDAEQVEAPVRTKAHVKPGQPPTFVPLDPFTVNLADKDVDRFAQIGITLQVEDPKFADQVKAYMPAIRSNILMVLSHKTAVELLTIEGKEKLARDIMRESVRPMGIELDDEEEDNPDAPRRKKKRRAQVESPVTQVLFSTFIVQ